MKKIKLLVLNLRNFKGVKDFSLEVNGNDANLYGDNATGKTSTFDAFLYLLFDKDSNNDSKFALQTLDKGGQKVHNLNHEVEGILSVNDSQLKLKKVYYEKWTRKRGSAHKQFDGYKTDHFIDDVPVAKKEYVKKIEEIVEEGVFKLLTSPSYANEQLKWQDLRKILIEVCGDVSDEDVVNGSPELSKLVELLSNKSVEDIKKIIASKRKHINDELEKIPVRIDEIVRSMPDSDIDVLGIKSKITELEGQIDEFKAQRYNIVNGAAIKQKKSELEDLERQLKNIQDDFGNDRKLEINQINVKVQELEANNQIITSKIKATEFDKTQNDMKITSVESKIKRNEDEMNELRLKFTQVNEEQKNLEVDTTCPTCQQTLQQEKIEEVKQERIAQYNEQKSKIQSEGLRLKQENAQLQQDIVNIQKEGAEILSKVPEYQEDIKVNENKIGQLKQKLLQLKGEFDSFATSEEYKSHLIKIEAVKAAIKDLENSAAELIEDIDADISKLEEERKSFGAELGKLDLVEQQKKRIAELEREQVKLAQEFEELEEQLFLVEEFTRKKVSMLEEKINSKFKMAKFKLFENQVNGGLQEVCQTLYNGVPYNSGLNNAAKINVGLDIINTLSEHYGVSAPIFIDNAESVTEITSCNSQTINLIVSEQDKKLRLEVK